MKNKILFSCILHVFYYKKTNNLKKVNKWMRNFLECQGQDLKGSNLRSK